MNLANPKHPVWSILRLGVVNASIVAALMLTSSNWDGETWVVLVALGASGASEFIKR